MSENSPNGTPSAFERLPSDLNGAFGSSAAASLRGLLPPRPRVPEQAEAPALEEVPDRAVPEQGEAPASDQVPEQGEALASDQVPERAGAVTTEVPEQAEVPAVPAVPVPRAPRRRRVRDGAPAPAPAPAPSPAAPTHPPAPAPARKLQIPRQQPAVDAGRRAATPTTNRRWGTARMTSREHVELLVLVALRAGPADGREIVARLRADSGGRLQAPANTVYRTLHRLARGRLVARRAHTGRSQYLLTDQGSRAARSRVREWEALSQAMEAVVRSNSSG